MTQASQPPEISASPAKRRVGVGSHALILAAAWTLVIVGLGIWNARHEMQAARELVRNEARAHLNKNLAFCSWAAGHGGVYVPPTERTPPNPYLSHIPDRDIETTAGKQLTLMDPAYMLRQLMEDYEKMYGVRGRIISNKPLNPDNAPDDWERAALESFERSETEANEFTEIDGEPYLRLMRPTVAEQSRLKCHEHQGYKEGDIRGGIGVSVAAGPYLAATREHILEESLALALIWLLGILGIGALTGVMSKAARRERKDTLALRESEARIRNISDAAGAYLWEIDDRMVYTYVTSQSAMVKGFPPEKLLGHTPLEFMPPEDIAPVAEIVNRAIADKSTFRLQHRDITPSGEIWWEEVYGAVFCDANGKVIGLRGTGMSINARKQTEQELLLTRTSVESASDSLYWMKPDASIINVNEAACRLLDYNRSELLKLKVPDIDVNYDAEVWQRHFPELKKNRSLKFESVQRTKDGRLIPVEIVANYVQFGNEEYNCAFVRDITERKRAEEQIAASLKEKEVLLREIHHRVKNNMQVIVSLLRMQARRAQSEQIQTVFDECRDRINAMSLIHESLYHSEDLARIDFEAYLAKLCRNLSTAYGASGKGIAVTVAQCNMTLDMDQGIAVGMVIAELVSNAFKHAFPFGEGGQVSVSLSSLDEEEVELIVQDDGKGLPEEIDILKSPSLGLQLAVAAVTRELGGSIEVERNGGTRFIVRFRCKSA